MLGRRLLVLFAVLLGLTALVTSLAPRPNTLRSPGVAQQPTPSETDQPTPSPTLSAGSSQHIEQTISADAKRPPKVRAHVGDVLALTVRGDVLDGVQIEELGELEPIEPGSPARFEILLEKPGELRVELVDAERLVGLVEVAPVAS
jgi:hypothetical protein